MEHLEFSFPGSGGTAGKERGYCLVGVVGSGNLEVLIEPSATAGSCQVVVDTAVKGFQETWNQVLKDFFQRQPLVDVVISINDGGATPAVVGLRLDQAAAAFLERRT